MKDRDFIDLIEHVKAGDEGAIRDLIQSFEGDLRTIVRGRLPQSLQPQLDENDLVQAVWQSVFRNDVADFGRFTNAQHFRGFLAGVTRNLVFEEHRRSTQTREYSLRREVTQLHRRGLTVNEIIRQTGLSDPSVRRIIESVRQQFEHPVRTERIQTSPPISLYFDVSEFSDEEIANILRVFSDLYRDIGGDALLIDRVDTLDPTSVLTPEEA